MVTIAVFLDTPERTSRVAAKLDAHPDLTVVATASNFHDFVHAVRSIDFTVSLVGAEVMEAAAQFRTAMREDLATCTTRLFLTKKAITVGQIVQGVHTGFDNYLAETDPPKVWHETVLATVNGTSSLRTHPLWKIVDVPLDMTKFSVAGFSDTDRDILSLLSEGLTNERIAEVLHLSNQTVRNKISRLMDYVGVSNRTQLSLVVRRAAGGHPQGLH